MTTSQPRFQRTMPSNKLWSVFFVSALCKFMSGEQCFKYKHVEGCQTVNAFNTRVSDILKSDENWCMHHKHGVLVIYRHPLTGSASSWEDFYCRIPDVTLLGRAIQTTVNQEVGKNSLVLDMRIIENTGQNQPCKVLPFSGEQRLVDSLCLLLNFLIVWGPPHHL